MFNNLIEWEKGAKKRYCQKVNNVFLIREIENNR